MEPLKGSRRRDPAKAVRVLDDEEVERLLAEAEDEEEEESEEEDEEDA
jgi:hypothetical protein